MTFKMIKIIKMSNLSVTINREPDLLSLKSSVFSALNDISDQSSKLVLVSCNEIFELDSDTPTFFLSEIISEKLLPLSQVKRTSAVEDIVINLILITLDSQPEYYT